MSQLWGGRFEKELNEEVAEFTTSLALDTRLWEADIQGSIAHARMLGKTKILKADEAEMIVNGLKAIRDTILATLNEGRSPFRSDAEDIHSEIERLLKEKIGAVAGKLHTARSRNDQVATACRLTLMKDVKHLGREMHLLQTWIAKIASAETTTILPGLTHFQNAQPVSLAHHLLAYFWMLDRDQARLASCLERIAISPLGAAALAGTSFAINRELTAHELGFSGVTENSMDAVSDRDFVIELLSNCSLVMMHLSRLCEEIIIWSAPNHGFLTLDDSVTTGSSIMPQKKNPDVAELIRGKTGRAYGALMGALTMMKGLPLAYNRDMQEDKFFAFQGFDVTLSSVRMMRLMLESAVFHRERMAEVLKGDFSNATDLADDLASKGMPFREAHEIVGQVVRYCLKENRLLEELDLKTLRTFSQLVDDTTLRRLSHRAVLNARTSQGGAAPQAVIQQLKLANEKLETQQRNLD